MRIVIIGVGAMGCLFGAYLAAGADVALVGHWPEQIAAIQKDGLTLIQPNGRFSTHHLPITNNPATLPPADLALVLVKSYQTEKAAVLAQQLLHRNGIALTLQNGVGNWEQLSAVLGPQRTALGTTTQAARIPQPGTVQHTGYGQTYLAKPVNSEQLTVISQFNGLLRQVGMETELLENVDGLVWGKLAVNAGINPLTALLRVPNGFLAGNSQARTWMQQTAEEVAAVARAQGIELPYPSAAERVLQVAQATAANYSSMLQDVLNGRSTEIDAICGAVVKYGRFCHVPTPLNEKLLEWVKKVESGEQEKAIALPNNITLVKSGK